MVCMGMVFSTPCEEVDVCERKDFVSFDLLEAVMCVSMLLDFTRADCFVTLFIFFLLGLG